MLKNKFWRARPSLKRKAGLILRALPWKAILPSFRRPRDYLPLLGCLLWLIIYALIPTRIFKENYSLVLTDRNGVLLGAQISDNEEWSFPPMGPLPEKFEKALLIFEDKRFYQHPGIDPLAIARAAWLNLSQGGVFSGGSTISMQAARIGLGPSNRTVWRKLLEMAVALKLELLHDKAWILRTFATHAPFGGNVVGMEAASWRYFGRRPEDLSWAESATLAILPNSPSLMRLDKNRDLLLAKRNRLLRRLADAGAMDQATLGLVLAESLPPEPYPIPRLAPHLLSSIKKGVFGPVDGHLFRSSLDREIQAQASELVRQHLSVMRANLVRNAALIIAENASGRVLAYVGNAPEEDSAPGGYVDIIQEPRSTGSLLKPFLYAGMLDDGQLLPERLVADIPTKYPGFAPENAGHGFRGAVPAYMALARSLNIPAIRLLREYSLDRFYGDLKDLGMSTLFRDAADYGLPLIIGGAEGKLWELTAMYAGLARNAAGEELPYRPLCIRADGTADGKAPARGRNKYSRGAAYLTLDALLRVQRPGAAENWEEFSSSEKIAWKTGTSQGNRDAWAIGVTARYTVGVWVGNADGQARPELAGTAAAAPLLFAAFGFLPDSAWFDKPLLDLKEVEICAYSGYPPGPHCGKRSRTLIPAGAHLPEPCPYCITAHLDASGSYRTDAALEGGAPILNLPWFVLPPAMEWYYRRANADYRPLPPYKPGARREEGDLPIGLIYPQPGSQVYIPRELDGSRGRMVAEAVHRDPRAIIYWHLDSTYLGATREPHSMGMLADPGPHVLTLVDGEGLSIDLKFTILDAR